MSECRPCLVDGKKKALFHKWVTEDELVLKCDAHFRENRLAELVNRYHKTLTIPLGMSTLKISSTFALVELEDGTIIKVKPLSIKFLDSHIIASKYTDLFRKSEE